MENIKVTSGNNTYIGIKEEKINKFIGLPYATTPRFCMPKKYESDTDIDCTNIEIDCPQESAYYDAGTQPNPNSFYVKEFGKTKEYYFDENVVSLNIYAPHDAKNAPVVVFLHGGAFEVGCLGDVPYSYSDEYAKRGIILVILGYRLNIFSQYDGLNLGLKDVLFGMKWINEHIKDFGGGGPVTLMGQSAGAMLSFDLLCSDKLKGLVDRAILMSGIYYFPDIVRPRYKNESHKYFNKMVKVCRLKESRELLELDDKSLYLGYMELKKKYPLLGTLNFHPSIDGMILKETQKKALNKGHILDIPMIIGVCNNDMVAPYVLRNSYEIGKKLYKQNHSCVYGYFFDRNLPGDNSLAFHAADLWYAFGNMEECWRPFEELDYKLKDKMIDYFSTFIKTGNPNNNTLYKWDPMYVDKSFIHFKDNDSTSIKLNKMKKICWDNFINKRGVF